jgi:Sec-independent protein translocase protein TatA
MPTSNASRPSGHDDGAMEILVVFVVIAVLFLGPRYVRAKSKARREGRE